jgi:hypothetical protein
MKTLLGLILTSITLCAQYSPASNNADCYFTETLAAGAARTSTFDNRAAHCDTWVVQVLNLSNNVVSFRLERSNDGSVWNSLSGTTSVAATTFSSIEATGNHPYISVNVTTKGTGDTIVVITGYNYAQNKNSASSSGPDPVPYTTLIDVASSTISYICIAKSIFDPDTNTGYPVCQISRITKDASGNVTKVQNAAGSSLENQIWANRAALTYK